MQQTSPLPAGIGLVMRVSSANKENESVRIVLDQERSVEYRSPVVPANTDSGQRLIVGLVPVGLAAVATNVTVAAAIGEADESFSVFAIIALM